MNLKHPFKNLHTKSQGKRTITGGEILLIRKLLGQKGMLLEITNYKHLELFFEQDFFLSDLGTTFCLHTDTP